MSDDPIMGLTPIDAHRIRVLLDIVRDLAACDPIEEMNDGYCTRYACQLCRKELSAADAVHRFYLNHADTCPWRRARELTT